MKSIALTGITKMDALETAEPEIRSDDEVLIGVSHIGVCGSDMHFYNTGRIGSNIVEYPFVLGHEGTGIVLDTGAKAGNLQKGQRIAIEPAMPCHKCDQCLSGRPNTCRNMKFLGNPGQSDGLLSERIVMPSGCCYPLPDHIDNELGVLAEPLSIAVWSGDLSGLTAGMNIGILGCGPIGLSVLKYSLFLGAGRLYVTDKLDYRLGMAKSAGAWWAGNPDTTDVVEKVLAREGEGLDIVFDCCGMQEAIDQAVELLKPGGKLMIVGIPEFDYWSFATDLTRRKEICIQNVRRQNERLQKAIDLIANGEIDMSPMITHRFTFNETGHAFDLVSGYKDSVMKAVIGIQ